MDGSNTVKSLPETSFLNRPRRMSIGSSQQHLTAGDDNASAISEETSELREQTADLSSIALYEGIQKRSGSAGDASSLPATPPKGRSRLSHILGARTSRSPLLNVEEVQVFSESQEGDNTFACSSSSEESSLLSSDDNDTSTSGVYNTFGGRHLSASEDLERQELRDLQRCSWKYRARHKVKGWYKRNCTRRKLLKNCVQQPLRYIPSVILGTLLNILDGVSYGMILFPLGESVFSGMGMAGLSMFYVSCVVAQLVYSLGGSMFKAGVGGEMIEVVPFFHAMATTIMHEVGTDKPDEVISTTIVSFALSSIITGGVFFFLGYARLGSLIGFFPRHILVGCVGGVGWFLVVTGIEVASRLGTLEYSFAYLSALFDSDVILKWTVPLVLALVLLVIQRFTHNSLVLPTYFILITIIFHLLVWALPQWSLDGGRDSGWIFEPPEYSEPWYSFYAYYDFSKVHYLSVLKTVPAMFALTFFGILHVPINVPALAASTGEDNVDVDRELISHGISNGLSGLLGSVQNYLVYTNSLLFIRSGGESRVAGLMLAAATFGVMVAGPVIVGFIPVMVVGSLIFLLGIELMQEALVDTYGRLSQFEYFTIVVIVVTMGAWDFVYGILAGIVLACVSFVIQASRTNAVKATYTGRVARSTVRRHAVQRKFLEQVGEQIYVLKLSGQVFFGTIVHIESTVRNLLDELFFSQQPIRYLVLDISAVTEIDFSAAEAFARMNRLLKQKGVYMLLCGAHEDFKVMKGLKAIRLWDNNDSVRLFGNLNSALEWCENEFLSSYYLHRKQYNIQGTSAHEIPNKTHTRNTLSVPDINQEYGASPRATILEQAAESTVQEDIQVASKWKNFKQPLPLMMQIFEGLSIKNEDFWSQVTPYFQREYLSAGTHLYESENDAKGFYLVESGILRADYDLEQGRLYESILAGTTCGELPFFSETRRTATVTAETDSVVWKLDKENWEKIKARHDINAVEIANELLTIALKLTVERFESITAYVLISSS
jgi:SulP family sulfate permease